jgi:hypothetical protein
MKQREPVAEKPDLASYLPDAYLLSLTRLFFWEHGGKFMHALERRRDQLSEQPEAQDEYQATLAAIDAFKVLLSELKESTEPKEPAAVLSPEQLTAHRLARQPELEPTEDSSVTFDELRTLALCPYEHPRFLGVHDKTASLVKRGLLEKHDNQYRCTDRGIELVQAYARKGFLGTDARRNASAVGMSCIVDVYVTTVG